MKIRQYQHGDEIDWVRCRTLAFLDTAYFDNVLKEKEKYENPAIELVAIEEGRLVGLLDMEYEVTERTVCSRGTGMGGMIWHIAVHPDFRRNGIGTQLLLEAEQIAKSKGLNRIEAWTRDDQWVNDWYVKNSFKQIDAYLHVYMDGGEEIKGVLNSEWSKLFPVQAFAHYTGDEKEVIKKQFKRVHECRGYEKTLD